MDKESVNEIAWQGIFAKHDILNVIAANGHAHIHASDIKVFREPRLMTKFDHRHQLPKTFQDNSLSILPTSRGGYIIGDFKTYHNFEKPDDDIIRIHPPTFLESLDYNSITSESTAMNCAHVSKILHHFTNEDELYATVNGRMSSSAFQFDITSAAGLLNIKVNNSQLEIDAGYEGQNSLCLFEAKNVINNDFLIRQLYYPFRLWNDKIKKDVRPIFLTYSNGIFNLREYQFVDVNNYNSIKLIKQQQYSIQEIVINTEVVQELIDTAKIVQEPKVPFPQANSFARILNLGELLMQNGGLTKEKITMNYGFTTRQTDYYSNALVYLGLVEITKIAGEIFVQLTPEGKKLYSTDIDARQLEFIKLIVSHKAFSLTLSKYFNDGQMPSEDEIVEFMKKSNLYNIGEDSTYHRRASTIMGWINWIISTIQE